jgi:hypothetical protein
MAQNTRRLSPIDRHRAELEGIAAAYFPGEPAFSHTLKTVLGNLSDDEIVVAGVPCFRAMRARLGILLVTNVGLLWVKQSFVRRSRRAVRLDYEDLAQLKCVHGRCPHHAAELQAFRSTGTERKAEPDEWFAIETKDRESFRVLIHMLERQVGSILEVDLPWINAES